MNSKIITALSALLICLGSLRAHADTLSLNDNGVHIDGGSMGTFNLGYPSLEGDGPGGTAKIIGKTVTGNTATVKYDSGTVLTVKIDGNDVSYSYQNVGASIKRARSVMYISLAYAQGGKWKMGNGTATPFPVDKPPKPHLYQGNASLFTLINFDGKSFTLQVPQYGYLELNDLREWNNSTYLLFWNANITNNYKITVTAGTGDPNAKPTTLADEFGQIKSADWPGKIKSETELADDAKNEPAYYASFPTPDFDKFGGLPNSGRQFGLQATGFFHVEKKGDKWMLVDPDGNLFFHLGLCSFQPGDDYTLVKGRRNAFDWLPPLQSEFKTAYKPDPGMGDSVFSFHTANMIRKYHKPYTFDDFESIMIDRVRKWGFNSVGAFSGTSPTVLAAKHFPYVSSIPLGGIGDIPGITNTWDPFDPDNVAKLQADFAKSLPPHADDPLLIGFFLTNEPLYEDIPKHVPGLKGTKWACKRALVLMLSDKYGGIDAFNKAWALSAASFDQLKDEALAVTTKEASKDMNDYTGKFFETYYKLIYDNFHAHDTHHMLIGNRFQSGTINNEQLCRTAGKYLDIMSFNYYTYAPDKDFLKRIYAWTGRPMFLSEFFWASSKESGLSGGLQVNTQLERGLAYRNFVEQTASLGFVTGVEWFTLLDEASTGRWFSGFTGERANSGIISGTDQPYKAAVAEMAKTNDGIYNVITGAKPPFVFDNPKFSQVGNAQLNTSVPHTEGPITVDGGTQNWPHTPAEVLSGKRVVSGTDSGGTEAAFKITWDSKYLYFLVSVVDPTPMQNKQKNPADLWDGDAVEIFLGTENIGQGGALQFSDRHLMIGVTGPGKVPYYYGNSPKQFACDTLVVPGGDGKSYTLEAAVPWEALGITPKVGTKLLFDIGIDDSTNGNGRQHQIMWNGTDRNSGDRTHWGTATLLE